VRTRADTTDAGPRSIERGIHDELIVGRQLPRADQKAIVTLHDRLDAWMRQLSVTDEDAETTRRRVRAMRAPKAAESWHFSKIL